jgi:hypothetical protein
VKLQILSSVIYFHILWKKLTHCPNSLGEVDNRFQLHLECHPDNQIQDILSEEHINVNAQNVLPDNEVADSSRGLISGTRSPAPERIYVNCVFKFIICGCIQ